MSAAHTADHLRWAVLEGIVFSPKQVLDRIENMVGPQHSITVSGHESEDEGWLRLRANAYNRPLALLQTSEPTPVYKTLAEAAEAATSIKRIIEPQPELAHGYELLCRLYRDSAESTGRMMRRWNEARFNAGIAKIDHQ